MVPLKVRRDQARILERQLQASQDALLESVRASIGASDNPPL